MKGKKCNDRGLFAAPAECSLPPMRPAPKPHGAQLRQLLTVPITFHVSLLLAAPAWLLGPLTKTAIEAAAS